ncbi:MAG TPA: hypothetical protein VGR01_08075 [Burkholderiales bacterium]|jgi:hypothetical protein|nr:hypothetical protein [Burkholderiales bacterium]
MAEDLRNLPPPGAEDEDDVLGKLDQLLHKHRPGISESGAAPVPELTDSLRGSDATVPGNIPTLVDMVSGPAREPSLPQRPVANPSANARAVLEAGINRRLAVKLELERARLLERIGNDPVRAQALDQLITELKRSLPAIVRAVLSDGPSRE